MSRAVRGASALAGAALWLLCACSDEQPSRAQQMPNVQSNALRCVAGTPRACPCVGQGMGMQLCNATGTGYDPCTGCPPPPAVPAGGSGGTQAPFMQPAAGSSAAGTTGMMPQVPPDAGMASAPDGGARDGGSDEPTPSIGKVRGVSCGVGLPTLCEIGKQKCCVRSLQTDTCIDSSASCDCPLQGCTVMETRCDGPEDCDSGQVCCGTLSQDGSGYDSFECAAQCQATGQQRVACHDGETECPQGLACANSQLLTNVQVCIDPSTIEQ